jgi:peptide deformylase
MALLKIARMGHPVLRQRAGEIDPANPEILRIANDMVETMLDAPGVGLAAPQVHLPIRLIVFRMPPAKIAEGEEPGPERIMALINPVVQPVGEEMVDGLEGCLSIPELRGIVTRHKTIRFSGTLLNGEPVDETIGNFTARVIQHEVDHLDGILYLDRMRDLKQLSYPEHVGLLQAERQGSAHE